MTCGQVREAIDLHLADGGTVVNRDYSSGTTDLLDAPCLITNTGPTLLELTPLDGRFGATCIGDTSDDMFLLPDGSIDYHTPKGNPVRQGNIQFLRAMPAPFIQCCDKCGKPAFDDSNLCGGCLYP